ncbi:trichohyalin-like isoform X1 [Hydractinia symbiolongicarpus]|uniref:trichohyalin-like isoform X1 n=1 Tax=Hydractinia symbiolongicarpus TaxID=13093 RepID=UPI00254E4B13|nr:trichohyalin-like isoform X1 [Hydractinia symbiolongicarpus]XP_057304073.1 trichohyalin-like isoform X1 [Hydractinia symbiolongicarpus]
MASKNSSATNSGQKVSSEHKEPEKPLIYEPPDLRGRKHVEKVAGEYRVREDEVLADKLQHEEFEFHYGKNKDERHRGQIDIKTAKSIYLREVEDSGLLSKSELKRLCKDDAWLAQEFQHRLDENLEFEAQRKTATEMQDEEFARYLEAKEKEKLELERKRRLERRIAQDRAAAAKLQRDLDAKAAEVDVDVGVETSQKPGWEIDFEVGASTGEKTRQDLHELQDAEVARQLQLKEAELEQKRLEEERDRRIAAKLQKQEAEEYRREKAERKLRREREQSEQNRTSTSTEGKEEQPAAAQPRTKHLRSVDATGEPIRTKSVSAAPRYNASEQGTPQRAGSESRPKQRQNSDKSPYVVEQGTPQRAVSENRPKQRQNSDKSQYVVEQGTPQRAVSENRSKQRQNSDKSQYVVEQGTPQRAGSESRSKQRQPSDKRHHASAQKSGEPIYLQAVDATGRRVESQNGGVKNEPRLVDDQRALQQQMRHVDQLQQNGVDRQRGDSKKQKNKQPDNTWGLEYQSSNKQRVEPRYDTKEKQHYNNVAVSIDPTYSSIDSLKRGTPPPSSLDEHGDVRAAPVIQNVKRPSHSDEKKKKKWFSKKEKSSS